MSRLEHWLTEQSNCSEIRPAKVLGGTPKALFRLSVVLLVLCMGTEVTVLVKGLPQGTSELVVGRVLGLLDAIAMTVLAYWYGTSSSSAMKTEMLHTNRSTNDVFRRTR